MAQMTMRVKELFEKVSSVTLATVDAVGAPNTIVVSAKKIVDDETILISDQYFDKTLVNLQGNSRVSVAFWQGIEGFQLKGKAALETSGSRFEETVRWIDELSEKFHLPIKSKGALVIHVEEVVELTPPFAREKK